MSMESSLALFKADLLKNYFKSTMFYRADMEKLDSVIPRVGYDGKKEDICACYYRDNLIKKKRRYAIFTESAFWTKTRSGRLLNGKYSQIEKVLSDGTIKLYDQCETSVSKRIAKRLKGIHLIYHLAHEEDLSLADYMVSFEKPVFGEYVPRLFSDKKFELRDKLHLTGLQRWLFYNLKIKVLTSSSVEFEVSLNDKDLQKGSFSDWEAALDKFAKNDKVTLGFQEIFYETLCIKYKPENIRFNLNGKIKTTLSTRLKNAADVVSNVADKAVDITERRMEETRRNCEREINEREAKVEAAYNSGKIDEATAKKEREKIVSARGYVNELVRRTDEELSKDTTGTEKPAKSFQYNNGVPLSSAMQQANNDPGVYILWLNGQVMKCGRSSQTGGVRKRLLEYYGLRYDKRAQAGDYWAVSEQNRDNVVVSWQCCPISKCHELEYKLFQKYGKGPWAHNAPISCIEDTWELLI